MEKELLSDLKNYYGDDYDENSEPSLIFCIKRALISFKNKRNYPDTYSESAINSDMKKYYACIFDLVLYWCNKQGYEFQVSHSENGVSRNWNSENDIYVLHSIIPIARII